MTPILKDVCSGYSKYLSESFFMGLSVNAPEGSEL
jgi:hypothetical protein